MTYLCMTRERRGQEFAVKVFLESNEKDYNKDTVTPRFRNTYLVAYSDFSIVFFDLLLVFIPYYEFFI